MNPTSPNMETTDGNINENNINHVRSKVETQRDFIVWLIEEKMGRIISEIEDEYEDFLNQNNGK